MVFDESLILEFKEQLKDSYPNNNVINHEAFPRWICFNYLNLDESDTDIATEIGGPGDSGIDIFHIDESEKIIYIVQAKYSEKMNHVFTREELVDFFGTLDRLRTKDYQGNEIFESKSNDFVDSINSNHGYRIKMIVAVTGHLSPSAEKDLKIWERKPTIIDNDVELDIFDLDRIENLIKDRQTPPVSIQFEEGLQIRVLVKSNERSLVGTLKAKELVKIYKNIGSALFSLNPRESKGQTSINKVIKKTLETENGKRNFWRYNNGLSAVCKKFNLSESKSNLIQFTNLKIVNGRQTTYALESQEKFLDSDVEVLIRVHETSSDEERLRISEYNNTQNTIKPSDLVSTNTIMRNLYNDFERNYKKWFFEYQSGLFQTKPRKFRNSIPKKRRLDKDNTARQFIAFNGQPYEAIKTQATEIFFTKMFESIFKNTKSYELIVPHIFFTNLNSLKNDLKKNDEDSEYYKILKEKVGINFVLSFIGNSLNKINTKEIEKIMNKIIIESESDKNTNIDQVITAALKRLSLSLKMTNSGIFSDSKKIRDYLLSNKKMLTELLEVIHKHESAYAESKDPVFEKLKKIS